MNDKYEQFKEKFFKLYKPHTNPKYPRRYKIVDQHGNTLVTRNGKYIFNQINHAKSSISNNIKFAHYRKFSTQERKEFIKQMVEDGLIDFVPFD